MADRYLDICGYCDAATWCWPAARKLKPMCGACRVCFFFDHILYKPFGWSLLPWQRADLRGIYGAVDAETGRRRIRKAYLSVAKKNGKSFLMGGLPLYHLTLEGAENPNAYGAASAKDQAAIVYRAARRLMRGNPLLEGRLKAIDSTRRIIQRNGDGFYSVISGDGDLQDGIEPSLGILDELHRWKTAKQQTNYDVVTKGMISRPEALAVQITTAGEVYESPICWREYLYAKQVLNGAVETDRYYASIYEADEQRLKTDAAYWKSKEARLAANPSHEDHGGYLSDDEFLDMVRVAEEIPEERGKYIRYNLNVWGQKTEEWMPMDRWLACEPTRPLIDRECWIGFDLSRTTDVTAMVLIFPDATDNSYDILPFFWLPAERITALEKRVKVSLSTWVREGHLLATEGNEVEYAAVREKVAWACENFRVRELCYDPWNATDVFQQLQDDGHVCIKVPQGAAHLNAAMKHVLAKTLQGKLRHDHNPVMTWMMDCVTARSDTNGNIKPDKQYLDRDGKRVDGVSALVTGMARAMLQERVDCGVIVV